MPKKYLLYARVSPKGSTWSAEETSIGVQFAEMRAHCQRIDPGAEFIEIFDEFKSGKNLNRPGVQALLADLDRKPCPWQCLVVWNLDRLSRSLCDALPIFTKLRDAGCEFISINQAFLSYTGAMARYMLHQTIALAELERGMTSERVSAKMRWIASEGKIPWGNIPLGYVRDPNLKNTVVVDPEKAKIVQSIFDLYISGKLGFSEINSRYPNIIRNRNHLYKILRQPLYIGELHYAGKVYQTEHPAIIDRAVFEKAQKMLADKKRKNYCRKGIQKYDYLLSGILRCHCGRHMTGYSVTSGSGRKFFYYKCTSSLCKNAVNAVALDDAVLRQIAAVYTDEAEIKKSLSAFLEAEKGKRSAVQNQASELKKKIQTAKEKQERIKQMFLSGVVTADNSAFWNSELTSARIELEALEKELATISAVPDVNFDDIFPELVKASEEWAKSCLDGSATYETKRNLIMSAVESLECVERSKKLIRFKMKLIMSNSVKWWALGHFVIIRFITLDCGPKTKISAS